MLSHLGIFFMQALSVLPLAWVRALGWLFGQLLFVVVVPRRRVALTNLALCFPQLSASQRQALARRHFVRFAQAFLDRSWLWHAPAAVVARRVSLKGAVDELAGNAEPVILFVPHFVGLDAAWPAVLPAVQRQFTTIYTNQSNAIVDRWVLRGRSRLGHMRLFGRADGTRTIVAALRAGEPLCLLPDMDFGPRESVFVPFFGVPAATVPSLSRFARLGRAKVVTILTRMTAQGYETEITPAWPHFPTEDATADTARMNTLLAAYIEKMPDQYYWVHKRFKTRPPGEPHPYSRPK